MSGEKNAWGHGEGLERAARAVVRASAAGEREAEAAAASPFLYARVRAAIEEERRRREEGEGWKALFGVALRAAPAMGLAAALSLALFLTSGAGERPAGGGFGDEALLGLRGGDIEQVVFADARTPSRDVVLSTILGADEREGAR